MQQVHDSPQKLSEATQLKQELDNAKSVVGKVLAFDPSSDADELISLLSAQLFQTCPYNVELRLQRAKAFEHKEDWP